MTILWDCGLKGKNICVYLLALCGLFWLGYGKVLPKQLKVRYKRIIPGKIGIKVRKIDFIST